MGDIKIDDTIIDVHPIKQLKDFVFFIPSYQRGYRWTEQQVEDLLNDVKEFKKGENGNFYCLQPLVTCKQKDNSFNVIDGQQRLTTLFLILYEFTNGSIYTLKYKRNDYIEQVCKIDIPIDSNLTYTELWDKISKPNPEFDTIEFYYLLKARYTIQQWKKKKLQEENENKEYIEKLENDVRFIWYPIQDSTKEHEYFKNLNSGKIPLTNAELIKALFLKSNNNTSSSKNNSQSLIADEYDHIERTLRNDDFWYFLAGSKEKPSSCIELLFDLILDSSTEKKKYTDKEFRTFFYFKENNISWEHVRTTFYILDGWYNNPIFYNLIGYLRACEGDEFSLENILRLYNNSSSKENFCINLKEKCKLSINYDENKFLKLTYKDAKIRNLLLLLNIATLLNNPESKTKFQFASYHKENWDVEHISPQNPKTDDILSFIIEKYKDSEMPSIIKNILEPDKPEKDNETKKQEIIEKLFVTDTVLNTLSNHTLLSAHTNRGIGNGFFFEKRQQLINYFETGYYIPPCSMNVFQKFYTKEPDNMDFWDITDQNQYLEQIENIITTFFNKESGVWIN